jgi:hypothetical protein
MNAETQVAIKSYRDTASHLTNTNQFNLAEQAYRHIIDTIQQHEGQEATYLDRYNLSNTLVLQHKYAEAEPILRDMLNFLAKRNVDDDSAHFLEQERGTVSLLVQSIRGQGRTGEADKLMVDAEFAGHDEQLEVRKGVYGLSV